MREFRFLDEKRKTNGLTQGEELRWQDLGAALGIDLSASLQPQPAGYYAEDGNWYPYPEGYDPNAHWQQQHEQQWPQQQPDQQGYYPPQQQQPYYDPNQQAYYPPQQPDPYAQPQAPAYDAWGQPQQQPYYDPNQQAYYPPQQPDPYAQPPQQQWPQPPTDQWGYPQQQQPQQQQWEQPAAPAWEPQAPVAPPEPAPLSPRASAPVFVAPKFNIKPKPAPVAVEAPIEVTDDVIEVGDEEFVEVPSAANKIAPKPALDSVDDLRSSLLDDDEPAAPVSSESAEFQLTDSAIVPAPKSALSDVFSTSGDSAATEFPSLDSPLSPWGEGQGEGQPQSSTAPESATAPSAPDPFPSEPKFSAPAPELLPSIELGAFDALPPPEPEPEAEPLLPSIEVDSFDAPTAPERVPEPEPLLPSIEVDSFDAPAVPAAEPEPLLPSIEVDSFSTPAEPEPEALPSIEVDSFSTPAEPEPEALPSFDSFNEPQPQPEPFAQPTPTAPPLMSEGEVLPEELHAVGDDYTTPLADTFEPMVEVSAEVTEIPLEPLEPVAAQPADLDVDVDMSIDAPGPTAPRALSRALDNSDWNTNTTLEPAPPPIPDANASFDTGVDIADVGEPQPAAPGFDEAPPSDWTAPDPGGEPVPWDTAHDVEVPAEVSPWDDPNAPLPAMSPPGGMLPDDWQDPTEKRPTERFPWDPNAAAEAQTYSSGATPTPAALSPWDSEVALGATVDPTAKTKAIGSWAPPALDAPMPDEHLPEVEAEIAAAAPSQPAWEPPDLPLPPPPPLPPRPSVPKSAFDSLALPPELAPRIPTFDPEPLPPAPTSPLAHEEVFASNWRADDATAGAATTGWEEADEPTITGTIELEPESVDGFAGDQVELASNADFIAPTEQVPSLELPIEEDSGDFVVESATVASLANNVSDSEFAPSSIDDGQVELANNADFLGHEQLTNAGEQWSDDRQSLSIAEPEDHEEDVIQGVVLEDDDAPPPMAEPEPHDNWGVAISQPSPVPVAARPPPVNVRPMPPPPPPQPQQQSYVPSDPVAPVAAPSAQSEGFASVPVTGEHRVILHTVEGQVKRGSIRDVNLGDAQLELTLTNGQTDVLPRERIKALFFMLAPGARAPLSEGSKVRVSFKDGRQVAGFSKDHKAQTAGFFVVPADNRTNTERIFIFRHAVLSVALDK